MQRTEAFGVTAKISQGEFYTYFPTLTHIEDALNKHLSLNNYGNSLDKVFMIFVSVGMSSSFHPHEIEYSRVKKELFFQYRLKDKMFVENPSQNLQILALSYLDALKEAQEKKRIKDFDFDKFRADVAKVFEAQDWLIKEAA